MNQNTVLAALRAPGFHLSLSKRRMLLPGFVIVLCLHPETRGIVLQVLADAFLQVSSFVLLTLALYYCINHRLKNSLLERISENATLGLLLAAFLGVLPGCGGAIIVVTQYTRGQISFGALVAVLTSTMGDAAFLLLSQEPVRGLIVLSVSFLVGLVTGYLVDLLHPGLKQHGIQASRYKVYEKPSEASKGPDFIVKSAQWFWMLVFLPACFLAFAIALQIDTATVFHLSDSLVQYFGAIAGFTAILLWSLSSEGDNYQAVTAEDSPGAHSDWKIKAALNTQFVTSWVVASFLAFELAIHWFNIDLSAIFQGLDGFVVLFAVLIGLLPGCGPQILVTSLYLQNAIPFSAQLANAISNDGDALFPAIALAPRAAIMATFYSAIPALVVGYAYLFLFQ